MALTLVTITGQLVNPDGSLPSGALMFQLVDAAGVPVGIADSVTGVQVVPLAIAGAVVQGKLLWNAPGGGGYSPLQLYANDDPTTVPGGTYYEVTEHLAIPSGGVQVGPWPFVVHHTNTTQDISTQRPASS